MVIAALPVVLATIVILACLQVEVAAVVQGRKGGKSEKLMKQNRGSTEKREGSPTRLTGQGQ